MLKPTECEVSCRTVIAGSAAIMTVIPVVGLATSLKSDASRASSITLVNLRRPMYYLS